MTSLMMRLLQCLLFCAAAMCPLLDAREFTNQKGATIEATLLEFSDGKVRLKRGGKIFTVPIGEFVEADQKHIRDWAKQQVEGAVSKHGIKSAPGLHAYTHSEGDKNSDFHVYIPKNYDGTRKLPLIVSAHGANQKGEKEIKGWMKLADEFSCIVVAATNLSGARRVSFNEHCIPVRGRAGKTTGEKYGLTPIEFIEPGYLILDGEGKALAKRDRLTTLHPGWLGTQWARVVDAEWMISERVSPRLATWLKISRLSTILTQAS